MKGYLENCVEVRQITDSHEAEVATEFGDGTKFDVGHWVLHDHHEGRYMRIPTRKPVEVSTRFVVAQDKKQALLNEKALHRSFANMDRAQSMADNMEQPVFEVVTKTYIRKVSK